MSIFSLNFVFAPLSWKKLFFTHTHIPIIPILSNYCSTNPPKVFESSNKRSWLCCRDSGSGPGGAKALLLAAPPWLTYSLVGGACAALAWRLEGGGLFSPVRGPPPPGQSPPVQWDFLSSTQTPRPEAKPKLSTLVTSSRVKRHGEPSVNACQTRSGSQQQRLWATSPDGVHAWAQPQDIQLTITVIDLQLLRLIAGGKFSEAPS